MPRPGAPRALALLRQRGFRLLTIGQVTSNVGDACYAVALPWYVLALAAVLVRRWGPTPFFLLAAVTTAVAILAGLSQRAWREFGASQPATPEPAIHREGQPV
jgi:hypothetical protein